MSENETANKEEDASYWSDFDTKIFILLPKETATSQATIEVDKYVNDTISRKEDPLQWWINNNKLYPNLAHLAKGWLCVVATSVPCERIFS